MGESDGEQLVLNHTNKSLIFKDDRILAQEGQWLLCPSACCVPALRTVPGTWQAPQQIEQCVGVCVCGRVCVCVCVLGGCWWEGLP